MRNILLGTLAGLAVGTMGALAYSHFLGDGALAADLQAQLDDANASLELAKKSHVADSHETSSAADQVEQLTAENDDLKKQLSDLKNSGATNQTPAINPALMGEMLRGMFRGGGGMQGQQRMFLLKTRLNLTPDQEAKIKAAMDADGKARRDLMRQWFQNGKIDPAAAAAADTLDSTLQTVLTPDQQAEYQKVQADEKDSRAQMMASVQVASMGPLLQLSDSQKDAALNAIYQTQLSAPDPTAMIADPNAMASFTAQAQATQAALTKVLSPEQLALYQQQAQSFNFGGFRPRGAAAANGGNTAATTTTAATAPPPAPPPPQ